MNKLTVILNTYKSLGVIPDTSNFEAVVSILQQLNFRKDADAETSMTRLEMTEWLMDFIHTNRSHQPDLSDTSTTGVVKLGNTGTNHLLNLRLGSKGDIRSYTDDYDDLKVSEK